MGVFIAGGGAVGHGGGLGDAHAQHAAGGAGGPGANAHHHGGGTGLHQLQGHLVGDAIAEDHRHAEFAAKPAQVEGFATFGTDVFGGNHRGLHKEEVGAGLSHGLAKAQGGHRRGTHGGDAPLGLDFLDPLADQFLLHRLAVEVLHQGHKGLLAHGRNPIQGRVGVGVAGLQALNVEYPQGAEPRELHGHGHINHAIHGTGDDRNFPLDAPQTPAAVSDLGVHRAAPGHQGDLIDAVGAANGA